MHLISCICTALPRGTTCGSRLLMLTLRRRDLLLPRSIPQSTLTHSCHCFSIVLGTNYDKDSLPRSVPNLHDSQGMACSLRTTSSMTQLTRWMWWRVTIPSCLRNQQWSTSGLTEIDKSEHSNNSSNYAGIHSTLGMYQLSAVISESPSRLISQSDLFWNSAGSQHQPNISGKLELLRRRSVHRHGRHLPIHEEADGCSTDCLVQLCLLCHVALQRRAWHSSVSFPKLILIYEMRLLKEKHKRTAFRKSACYDFLSIQSGCSAQWHVSSWCMIITTLSRTQPGPGEFPVLKSFD